MKISKKLIILLSILVLITVGGIFLVKIKTREKKTQICPESWESGYGMPRLGSDYTAGPESRIYIKGAMYDANTFDLKWIKQNCAITEPTPLPV